jgi:CTP:molybdopterin cytidylyltransferase MocA
MGRPKALVPDPRDPSRTLVQRAVEVLQASGPDPVLVVTGASAPRVRELAERSGALVVDAPDWSDGQSASLRTGLRALADLDVVAACVLLVDLPDVGPDVVRRVLNMTGTHPASLARAAYASVPGHPVLIGRDHWDGVAASAAGDRGARAYLATHATVVVECGDLATGRDVDTPADLR